jgi:hypothetical protein
MPTSFGFRLEARPVAGRPAQRASLQSESLKHPGRWYHTQRDQTDCTEGTEPCPPSAQSSQGVWLEWRLDKPRVKRKGAIIAVA